jgi:4-amino-4-deoxy-L-arabinose transferase-like glycosyltransferase
MDSSRGLPANALAFGLPAVFALVVSVSGQWWSPHAFDADEGINLGKAALVAAGFHPYADIWNDQPPLLTYILAGAQELFPWSLGAARLTILLFACLLLHSVFTVVRQSAGTAAAATSVVLLATAPLMWRLSISVMIGLPAVALAMSACAIVYRRHEAGLIRGAVAGLVFALSLQTKLFTAAAFPAFLAMAYLSGQEKSRTDRVRMSVVALSATAAGFLAIELAVGEPLLTQLISPHVAEEVRSGYSLFASALRLGENLIQQPFVLFATLLAVVWRPVSDLQKAWLIWIGCTVVVLLGHTPLRYHHVFLLLVPMACLGGEALWRFLWGIGPGWNAVARYRVHLAIVLPIALFAYAILLLRPFHLAPGDGDGTARLLPYAQKDPFVATDQPFEAFQARLLVLPELVVFSKKRIDTHSLTAATLIEAVAARRPGQVMLRKAHVDRSVLDYLDSSYVRVNGSRIHYVRPDLAG